MVWGPFSEAVELGFRSTHEEHMKRKIIHLAEKKLIPTDGAETLRNQILLMFECVLA